MNAVLRSQFFDGSFPLINIKIIFVNQRDDLALQIYIGIRDFGEFTADVFNQRSARCAVHAGDGKCCLHGERGELENTDSAADHAHRAGERDIAACRGSEFNHIHSFLEWLIDFKIRNHKSACTSAGL